MSKHHEIFDLGRQGLQALEQRLGLSRREYLQFCATLAVTIESATQTL